MPRTATSAMDGALAKGESTPPVGANDSFAIENDSRSPTPKYTRKPLKRSAGGTGILGPYGYIYFAKFKRQAYKDKKTVEMSPHEWFSIVTQPCKLCGGYSLKKVAPNSDTYIVCNTVDRIDSGIRVYRANNCQPLCFECNMSKRERSDEEFEQHILKIVLNNAHLMDQVLRIAALRGNLPLGEEASSPEGQHAA